MVDTERNENDILTENRNIALAEKCAEQMLQAQLEGKGKCPTAILTHYLSLAGSAGEREAQRQKANNELLAQKAKQIKLAEEANRNSEEAKEALYRYRGKK